MSFCPKCGKALNANQNFCDKCGTQILPEVNKIQKSNLLSSFWNNKYKRFSIFAVIFHIPFILDMLFKWTNEKGLISWMIIPTFLCSIILIFNFIPTEPEKKPFVSKLIGLISFSYFIYGLIFFVRGEHLKSFYDFGYGDYWYALPMWTLTLTILGLGLFLKYFVLTFVLTKTRHPKDRKLFGTFWNIISYTVIIYAISIPVHYIATSSVREHAALARIEARWVEHMAHATKIVADTSTQWPIKSIDLNDYTGIQYKYPSAWKGHIISKDCASFVKRFHQTSDSLFSIKQDGDRLFNSRFEITPSKDFIERMNKSEELWKEYEAFKKNNSGEHWLESASYPIYFKFSSLDYQN